MKKLILFILVINLIISVFAQTKNVESQNYRGQRTYVQKENPLTQDIYFVQDMLFEVKFSTPVDPRTLKPENILLNEKPLSPETKITFNREGTVARFSISQKNYSSCTIKISGVKTFDGQEIKDLEKKL